MKTEREIFLNRINELRAEDMGETFVTLVDTNEVVDYLYNPEVVYRDLKINDKQTLIDIVTERIEVPEKEWDNVIDVLSSYATNIYKAFPDNAKIDFVLKYELLSDKFITALFVDFMVETQNFQQKFMSLTIDYVLTSDEIADLDKFIKSAKDVNKPFNQGHLYKVLEGFFPLL